jgi:hypothetical protein
MSAVTENNDIFKAAAAKFLLSIKSLSDEQQNLFASCTTPKQLLQDIQKLDAIKNKRRFGNQHSARIERFVKQVKPYFDVVDIVVQCDPIHAATVWGGLRLVIQVCNTILSQFISVRYHNFLNVSCRLQAISPHSLTNSPQVWTAWQCRSLSSMK